MKYSYRQRPHQYQPVAPFGKAMDPLGYGALLEEAGTHSSAPLWGFIALVHNPFTPYPSKHGWDVISLLPALALTPSPLGWTLFSSSTKIPNKLLLLMEFNQKTQLIQKARRSLTEFDWGGSRKLCSTDELFWSVMRGRLRGQQGWWPQNPMSTLSRLQYCTGKV